MSLGRLILAMFIGAALSDAGTRVGDVQAQGGRPSFICPMDPDVLEQASGACPVCRMPLQPALIESAWSCPVHAAVIENDPGRCPLDGRDLVKVIVNHFWDCGDDSRTTFTEPGKCGGERRRQERRLVRAHGDHNPRHGGQFFMAADHWHHLEGTYPSAGTIRLYVYDNFTQPIEPAKVSGRVFTREENGREIAPVPLRVSQDGRTLEARLADQSVSERVVAKVRFGNGTEQRFDFMFDGTTVEPVAPPPPPSRVRPSAPSTSGETKVSMSAPVKPVKKKEELAESMSEVLRLLATRTREIRTLIDQGNYASVYVPTMIAKDIALQCEERGRSLPAAQRERLVYAVRHVVLAAWTLDQLGDAGNRDQLIGAHEQFARAVAEIRAIHEGR
jgi:hypothetical protein